MDRMVSVLSVNSGRRPKNKIKESNNPLPHTTGLISVLAAVATLAVMSQRVVRPHAPKMVAANLVLARFFLERAYESSCWPRPDKLRLY